jgi:hypothetical protein
MAEVACAVEVEMVAIAAEDQEDINYILPFITNPVSKFANGVCFFTIT